MRVFSITQVQENIAEIIQILSAGGVLVCPSDTTYGLLVDATNKKAVEKLIKLKERPRGKPISIFVDGWEMMAKYVDISKLTPEVRSLLPGSYTIVLPSLHATSSLLEAEDGTIGVRLVGAQVPSSKSQVPNNTDQEHKSVIARSVSDEAISSKLVPADFVTSLVAQYGKPLTATSANISGGGLCYSSDAFFHQLSEVKKELVDAVIDAGELPHNPPSTVIHLGSHMPVVLRANDADFLLHKEFVSKSPEETAIVAQKVFEIVRDRLGSKPIVILLDGELGSGKTTWTKSFAQYFGIQNIVSPTYTYECEYETYKIPEITRFKHYDLYNITQSEDIAYLEIAKHCKDNTISCIEWSGQLSHEERIRLANSTYLVRILFEYVEENERRIRVWWN
jgi:L-threonylcarbamoyladenylate synthase